MPDMPLPAPLPPCELIPSLRGSQTWNLVYAQTFTGLYTAGMAAVYPEPLSDEETERVAEQAYTAADAATNYAFMRLKVTIPGPTEL